MTRPAGPRRDRALERAAEALAGRFLSRFPERAPRPRTVGREAEFTLVRPDGRAGDASLLWGPLLEASGGRPVHDQPAPDGSRLLVGVETDRWFCLAEVGRGTVEVGVGPAPSLGGLARDLEAALAAILPVVRGTGQLLLGYGIQPRTPPHPGLMTPKRRYLAFLEVVGRSWLRFGLTASDQVHVDVGRDELVPMMNALNAASGAIVALAANSSVYGGRAGRFASGREGLMARMVPEPFRHGPVPRPFADALDYVRWTLGFRCLVLPDGRGGFRGPRATYAEVLRREGPRFEDWTFHEHYLWPSARPRSRLGTLEIRPACQQPGGSFAAAAFEVGLAEAWREVTELLRDLLGPRWWRAMLAYRARAVREGVRAREPVPGLLAKLLDLAESALRRRGFGEERELDEMRERLERREIPADLARRWARDGSASLAAALALR
ncbi:MAG TPA: glutamate-cysteine ligase family protein [Actinomycetota bacterium]|nr:glutamate-cysteine ligase family protein [Actinomycetota bacterium]